MKFYDSVWDSDWSVSQVVRLLDAGTGIDKQDLDGNTVLYAAISKNKWDTVKLLIDRGADINITNNDRETPLHRAAGMGLPKITAMLLKAGADLKCEDMGGRTPLHIAVRNSNHKITEMLLKAGADLKCEDMGGRTPLHIAVRNSNHKITEMLLKAGSDVNSENISGDTPLHVAALSSNHKIAEMLLEAGAVVNCKDLDGPTLLHIAARNINPKIAALFLKSGIEVNYTDRNGETPLHYAAREGCPETAALLLESGASVNSKDNEGRTPLHYAGEGFSKKNAISNSVLTASLLVANGGNVNCVDIHGQSPLHYAARNCHPEITALLLEYGANVNCNDDEGRTPLHVVGQDNKYNSHLPYLVEVLDLLLCAGARLDNKVQEDFQLTFISKLRIFLYIKGIIQLISANIHKKLCELDVDAMIDMNVKDINYRSKLQSFKHECCDEVKKMKQKYIGNLTLFDVFNDSPYPGFLSKADEIEKVLDQAERQNEYPIYIELMKYRFKRAVRRRDLMDEAMDILPSLNPALAIPELGQMILARLSERDMTALISAFETDNRNISLNVFNHLGPDLFLA